MVARFNSGRAWDDVVAYRGRNATNLVHYDGKTLHIVEAKGGAEKYGSRNRLLQDGTTVRISQTNPTYPKDIAAAMTRSRRTDGRNQIGGAVLDSYKTSTVSYSAVRTNGHKMTHTSADRRQTLRTFLEEIFKQPTPKLEET